MAGKAMPWFKMFAEARNDAKLRALSADQFRVWFNLLCFAAEPEQAERGAIPPMDAFLLAVEVAGGDEQLLSDTLKRLAALRIIEVGQDGAIGFLNFRKRQYEKPSDAPEAVADRVSRHRAAKASANETRSSPDVTPCNADVTRSNATEEDVEVERESIANPAAAAIPRAEAAAAAEPAPPDRSEQGEIRAAEPPPPPSAPSELSGLSDTALLEKARRDYPPDDYPDFWERVDRRWGKAKTANPAGYVRPCIEAQYADCPPGTPEQRTYAPPPVTLNGGRNGATGGRSRASPGRSGAGSSDPTPSYYREFTD